MERQPNRRQFLAVAGAGTFALAGCTDSVGDLAGGNGGNGNGNGEGEDDELVDGNGDEGQVTPPAIDQGELVSDFEEDIDEWFALEGELVPDEEVALTGSQAARVENDGATAGLARSYPDGLDIEGHHLSLAVRVDSPRPARVTVRLHAPGQADQLWGTRTVLGPYEGWLRMDVGYTGQRGEPFLDDVQEVQITLDDPNTEESDAEEDDDAAAEEEAEGEDEAEGDGISFAVDDLRMTPAADQGYVMLTFDDGVESQYENAFSMLEERDMQAVAAVITDSLNREGRLSIDQLREMRDAGWDISSHPEGEAFMELDDPEAIRADIESAHDYLDNRGFPDGARHMFVPYHNINQEVVDIAREYHETCFFFAGNNSIAPPSDTMQLSRVDMHDVEGFTSLVDMAARHNQLAVGLAHGVESEGADEDDPLADITDEQLREILDYIEASAVEVITPSQLIDSV